MAATKRRERLDVLLVERGLVDNRTRAKALILAGQVVVDERRRDKAGDQVSVDATIVLKAHDDWASRGAHKLLGALSAFPWLADRVRGADCLDVGASTGGFTDVLLRNGASSVVAVDVGYGQLVWRLQSDPRVTVMDRTNVRHLTPDALAVRPSVVTCDASFISVTKFLSVLYDLMAPEAVLIVLVKPQFEVGRGRVGKGGVVRDEALRQSALADVREVASALGFVDLGATDSPLAGPKGNREFLLALGRESG